ncbi:MAG: helix-turn-helix domain-containing protein, partial [Bryobacteraceae bacterium]
GGLQIRRSDFRVIAATNRDLAAEVEHGAFRRDLFYRLNVVTVRLVPLRDRREDIPILLQHFLERHGKNHSLTQEVIDAMSAYDWPGNVRELENSVQHMAAINSGPLLHVPDLPSAIQNYTASQKSQLRSFSVSVQQTIIPPTGHTSETLSARGHILPLMEVERRAILECLHFTKGDRATAAIMLGIGRTTLYRKLKEYELEDK